MASCVFATEMALEELLPDLGHSKDYMVGFADGVKHTKAECLKEIEWMRGQLVRVAAQAQHELKSMEVRALAAEQALKKAKLHRADLNASLPASLSASPLQ